MWFTRIGDNQGAVAYSVFMHDHDQRFKILIQTFFGEFLLLFFAVWAERLDCSRVEWLDKEAFPDPPQGDRTVLDLVGKLPTKQAVPRQNPEEESAWLALVHIEIESPDKAAPLRPRMYRSYNVLRERHGLPILPIAIFLRVGLNGIGIDVYEEYFWELRPVRFEYLYVGLPVLDALEYLKKDNWVAWALASLMNIGKEHVAFLGAEALKRISEAPLSDQKRFLLGECVRAYLPLDEAQKQELCKLLITERYAGVQAMNKTVFEEGIEKGIEKGVGKGVSKMLRVVMEERFGALPPKILQRLEAMSEAELIELGKAVVRVESFDELGLDKV
jgi:hypothetical protein